MPKKLRAEYSLVLLIRLLIGLCAAWFLCLFQKAEAMDELMMSVAFFAFFFTPIIGIFARECSRVWLNIISAASIIIYLIYHICVLAELSDSAQVGSSSMLLLPLGVLLMNARISCCQLGPVSTMGKRLNLSLDPLPLGALAGLLLGLLPYYVLDGAIACTALALLIKQAKQRKAEVMPWDAERSIIKRAFICLCSFIPMLAGVGTICMLDEIHQNELSAFPLFLMAPLLIDIGFAHSRQALKELYQNPKRGILKLCALAPLGIILAGNRLFPCAEATFPELVMILIATILGLCLGTPLLYAKGQKKLAIPAALLGAAACALCIFVTPHIALLLLACFLLAGLNTYLFSQGCAKLTAPAIQSATNYYFFAIACVLFFTFIGPIIY
ncbi:MAG: hypothetical protein R3Y56_09705 [Akkermansia sp.]